MCATLVEVEGAPHGLLWTHTTEANQALLDFIKWTVRTHDDTAHPASAHRRRPRRLHILPAASTKTQGAAKSRRSEARPPTPSL
ncbi:hypothetical protein [Microtetraspora sp. NBRC 16547]|uniref:hypothetical protein n=1 Tax=Microtetraspora sp. NBRC 16547 TaxID=3030993 RepID=UPI0024A013E0|nr:hypothetical protein [Microtetraspora sp. NBRC 16547]GLX02305.1 hypothetical protein Misp02_63910 [Microtetraspora sp. NBRC 16547]